MSVKWLIILVTLGLLFISGMTYADPAPLEMTMDKTGFIHLDQDAASVIVADPAHVSVVLDNPRLLLLTPHQEGVTSIIVLDANGKTILQRDIAITNVESKYVRVRRQCVGSDASCAAKSYDFCPDGCYEVTAVPPNEGGFIPPPPPRTPGSANGAGSTTK